MGGASVPTDSGAPSGDVSELAARVIAGEFGNGEERGRCPVKEPECNELRPRPRRCFPRRRPTTRSGAWVRW